MGTRQKWLSRVGKHVWNGSSRLLTRVTFTINLNEFRTLESVSVSTLNRMEQIGHGKFG
jgi:hypothetical protein